MPDLITTLTTEWDGLTAGQGRVANEVLQAGIALPQSYGGSGHGANPKDLLLASAASCLVMTLASILDMRKRPHQGLSIASTLTDKGKQGMTVEHVVSLTLPAGSSEAQQTAAAGLVQAAEEACPIGQLLKAAGVPVHAEAKVAVAA